MADPTLLDGDVIEPSAPVVRVPIDSIFPDPDNVRLHPEKNLQAVMASLQRFGQRTAITIDADRIIRKGNGTWEAARRLGWTHIDVAPWDARGPDATAYAITDNRTSELAAWDFEPLSTELGQLQAAGYDLAAIGWDEHDLAPLLAANWVPPVVDESQDTQAPPQGRPVNLTVEQRQIFDQAVHQFRQDTGEQLTEGRILELIAADWLAGLHVS